MLSVSLTYLMDDKGGDIEREIKAGLWEIRPGWNIDTLGFMLTANRAFSTVIADNQYASLGLMLMGCLARLNKLISFPKDEDEEVDEVVKVEKTVSSHVLNGEDFGEAISREELEGSVKKVSKSLKTPKKEKKSPGEQLEAEPMSPSGRSGLSVSTASKKVITNTVTSESDDAISPAPQPTAENKRKKVLEKTVTTTSTKTTAPKPLKKKRKKGGDEFDDLFSGLI